MEEIQNDGDDEAEDNVVSLLQDMKIIEKFPLAPMGSSLPGLRTLDPPLGPPSTPAKIFWHTCLQSQLQDFITKW